MALLFAESDSTVVRTETSEYRSVSITSSYRCFTAVLEDEQLDDAPSIKDDLPQDDLPHSTSLDLVRTGVIGRLEPFDSPFGIRPIVYADWTASGRGHKAVEDFLNVEVLPLYGNTHTTTSITGNQSTCFRHEARQTVAEAVNAKVTGRAAQDVVLFTGSGCTAAIDKLVRILGLHLPAPGVMGHVMDESLRPVVFVGPMEHHSNLLPWRESAALVIQIQLGVNGTLDLDHLEEELINHRNAPFKIGSFSAASNVSGLVEEVDLVTRMLHHYDTLACWDYASSAPYIRIDMNPLDTDAAAKESRFKGSACKDAVFFSPHKFVGGIGAPGVLVVKKRLLENKVPSAPGGGTVFYVTTNSHRYLSNREEREEGGTPDIVGTCRCALAFRLKQWSGHSVVDCHRRNMKKAYDAFSQCPKLVMLANGAECLDPHKRLPTYSFMIRWSAPEDNRGRWLHYNFVGALLNDLFGVQCRGGCQCAGPYGQQLLNMDTESGIRMERCLMEESTELLRPGFSRLSLPYTLTDVEVDFVINAVLFVAEHGWKFLPQYRLDHKTGECKHRSRATKFPNRKWLGKFSLTAPSSGATAVDRKFTDQFSKMNESELEACFAGFLEEANRLAVSQADEKQGGRVNPSQSQDLMLEGLAAELRWFVYPSEARDVLAQHGCGAKMPTTMLDPFGVLQPQSIGLNLLNSTVENRLPATNIVVDELAPIKGKKIKYPYRSAHSDFLEPPVWAQPKVVKHMLPPKDGKHASSIEPDEKDVPTPIPVEVPTPVSSLPSKPVLISSSSAKFHGVLLPNKASADDNKFESKEASESVNGDTETLRSEAVEESTQVKKIPSKLPIPPKKMMRAIGQAIRDWKMINDGDSLVVGLSGGKDSLSLLCALVDLQRRAPVKFSLAAVTIDPMTPSFDPSPLKAYLKRFGITYHYLSNPIIDRAAGGQLQGDSLCAFCSRMKRGMLYGCCRDNGYNKLVLGQHLDDLAESFIMSSLHNGQIRTMKANYKIEAGDVSVIRPLVYVREFQTKEFAKQADLPIINENCPACFEEPKERHRVKKMLAREEALAPEIFPNLKTALLPLMAEGVYPYMDLLRAQVSVNEGTITQQTRKQALPETKSKTAETPSMMAVDKDSVKWSSDCLSVVPDSWLEEELKRRRDEASAGGGSAIFINSLGESGSQELKLCNTGKCEMFD